MKPAVRIKLDSKKVFARAEELGMTRVELSKKCGYTDAWIYGACDRELTEQKAALIAGILGTDVDALVETDQTLEQKQTASVDVGQIETLFDDLRATLESMVDEINNLNLVIASHSYRIAEGLEKIAKGINEPWTDAEDE